MKIKVIYDSMVELRFAASRQIDLPGKMLYNPATSALLQIKSLEFDEEGAYVFCTVPGSRDLVIIRHKEVGWYVMGMRTYEVAKEDYSSLAT